MTGGKYVYILANALENNTEHSVFFRVKHAKHSQNSSL